MATTTAVTSITAREASVSDPQELVINIAALQKLVGALVEENKSLKQELSSLKGRVDNLEAQAAHHQNLHTAYAKTVPPLEHRVTALTSSVESLRSSVKSGGR